MTETEVLEKKETTIDSPSLGKGRELVKQLFVGMKTAQIYDQNNAIFLKQSNALMKVVDDLIKTEGWIQLKLKEGYIFLNEVRLKFDFEGYTASRALLDELPKQGVESITIEPGITQRELDKFVYLFLNLDPEKEDTFETLQLRLDQVGIKHIKLGKLTLKDKDSYSRSKGKRKEEAKRTFFHAVAVIKDVTGYVEMGKVVPVVKLKRATQKLVDQIIEDEETFLGFTAIKNFDEYTYVHSTNVCVLAVLFGLRLGLDKRRLSELGFAALFHDVGKIKLPYDLIAKPSEFDENDWKIIKKHPFLGAKSLLGIRSLDEFTQRAIVVAFEHHLNLDLSGYPEIRRSRELNLFSRIVSIADAYDAMTSGRVYLKEPISPDEALRKMLYRQGMFYDPVLLKVFVNVVGVYPVGTLVFLNTGEIGLVFKINPDDLARPQVRIIAEKGSEKKLSLEVDLGQKDKTTGEYARSIVQTLDPSIYKIDLSTYFL
jgi:HD-GYP domain-containing protein (c-di-GMP phosphodiesterase class II)